MNEPKPTIEINFYLPHLDDREIPYLHDEMIRIAPVRLREVSKELGGDEVNIWILVQWVGLAIASGIIQHITSRTMDSIGEALRKYRTHCKDAGFKFEEAVTLILSYDDIDIDINLPSTTELDLLPQILTRIRDELETGLLESGPVVRIFLPFFFDDGEASWRQTFDWTAVGHIYRYWGVQRYRYSYGTDFVHDIYDSDEHRFIHAPQENILPNVM